jgi:hypothetical protein
MSSKDRLDVFLSSDQEEFEDERKTLSEKIRLIPFLNCVPLEERGANTVSVEEASIAGVKECDIYVGIFGSQYSGLTIKEYEEAVKHRKLCINYVKKTARRDSRLRDFVGRELKDQFKYHEFRSRKDLYSQVEADLYNHLSRLLRMGLAQLKNSKKQALVTETELKPIVAKAIKQKEEDRPLSIMGEAEASCLSGDFMAATVKAAIAVELAARLALLEKKVPSDELRKASLGRLLGLLRNYNMLGTRDTNQLQELIYLRNATIHEGIIPSRETTAWILKLAGEVVEKLR